MGVQVGQAETVTWTFDQEHFDRFAALTGDDNPIHVDPAFSARTRFGATVAHGMLLYGTVCGVLGTRLPGPGTVQMEQSLMFPSPTYAGEEVVLRVEVVEAFPGGGLAELSTVVIRPSRDLGLEGTTRVCLPAGACQSWVSPAPTTPVPRPGEVRRLKGLEIGQRVEMRRTFTAEDVGEYAEITGDTNPVLHDAGYARGLGLDGPILPGSLIGGLFSRLLGTRLPGPGTNYLKQRLWFPAPAFPGQELTAAVEITRIRPEKALVNLRTNCVNPAGEPVCTGEALVLVRDVEEE